MAHFAPKVLTVPRIFNLSTVAEQGVISRCYIGQFLPLWHECTKNWHSRKTIPEFLDPRRVLVDFATNRSGIPWVECTFIYLNEGK
ncbi:hypothetical protein BFP76_08655 [Amylibacter kogurei]|uniref:Uncharacterized protein n=1 Tax=Paramylibacter kogurei TaxID=1889778 RepID=A0A2G5K0M0_9RHOB|nr:hypothetical protein BFP76_08655 [Amylibacter kogurei]